MSALSPVSSAANAKARNQGVHELVTLALFGGLERFNFAVGQRDFHDRYSCLHNQSWGNILRFAAEYLKCKFWGNISDFPATGQHFARNGAIADVTRRKEEMKEVSAKRALLRLYENLREALKRLRPKTM
jgi:hypothetical protein